MSIKLSNALKMAAIATAPVLFSGCCFDDCGAGCDDSNAMATKKAAMVKKATPTYRAPYAGTVIAGLEAPAQVNVGQVFTYQIPVTNYINDCGVADLKVMQDLGDNLQIISSTPKANISGNQATWNLGDLNAGKKKVITVKAKMTKAGSTLTCAKLDYVKKICKRLVAVEPALNLDMRMAGAVLSCEKIPVELKVSNTGSGTAKNVVVNANLPAGLTTNQTSWNIGDLPKGSSRSIKFMATAKRVGNYAVNATTAGAGGLKDSEKANVVVTEPMLKITQTGPSKLFLGRNATYKVKVSNSGTAPAQDLIVRAKIPTNSRFVSSKGGTVSNGYITWKLNPLAVHKAYVMSYVVKANSIGAVRSEASAVAKCAKKVTDKCAFVAKGIPAILLEVVDVQDPVEVGGVETYIISCTNQGSATATNIVVTVEVEDIQQLIAGTGATKGRISGKVMKFAPLASLGAKKKTYWKVTAKALKPGSIRFKASMTSDQLSRPVKETEATTQY